MPGVPWDRSRWLVVLGAFGTTFVAFGCVYAFGAFVEPLQREFGASRAGVSAAFSLAGCAYFSVGALSGPASDRWGAPRLILAGMLLVAVGMAGAGVARSLGEVLAAYGLGVGLGVGLVYVPALGAVQRWFVRDRALASGLAVSGIGVGTMAIPPIARWLIGAAGWRHAYLWIGVFAAVLGSIAALAISGKPPRMPGASNRASAAPLPVGKPLRHVLVSRAFGLLYLSCLLCALGAFVPFVHLVPYAVDHGIAGASAVNLLVLIGVSSSVGRFALGWIADRLRRRHAAALMYAGMAAAFGLWGGSTSWVLLVAFALIYGTFYGGWAALMPALVADSFGAERAGSIIGALYTSVGIGTLLGPTAAGWLFDSTHGYGLAIALCAVLNVAAALLVLRACPGAAAATKS